MYQLPKRIAALTPYTPLSGDYRVRLDANESFLSLSDTLREQIANAVRTLDFNRYPDPNCTALCSAFASFYGVDAGLVVAGNGSDELIGLLVGSFVGDEGTLVTVTPDFSMYSFYAQLGGVQTAVFQKPDDSLVLDSDALIAFCRKQNARMLLFSNPCNPTSLLLSRQEVLKLADALPECLVIADEAYMDFAEGSVLDQVGKCDNLVVLKTCSKALGMAAIRLGFAVCPPDVARALSAVKSPYNVNSMTQAAGCVLFANPAYLRDCTTQITASRTSLFDQLRHVSQSKNKISNIYDTETNFVFLQVNNADEVACEAAKIGIALRKMGRFLRITAGSNFENQAVIAALEQLL